MTYDSLCECACEWKELSVSFPNETELKLTGMANYRMEVSTSYFKSLA